MKTTKNIFIILILSLFSFSCSGSLDGFKMKKSTSGDEFLIQKKDPLVQPPDYSELPNPGQEIKKSDDEETEFEIVFKNENSKNDDSKNSDTSNSNLKKSILKKIRK